ncbi:uncharacterized protein LOC110611174 [Manihot esculenta]|uniref:Uncharacterized protein n=1 Tax=Manihot esculenta TaxID=3983 RepID=A0ACB7I0B4_MANES|nr:uncharacterized protein LOC110611174 [Manihot esculenta]KAG8658363.1 hypothetical protein MANES_03G140000v8 [Manihot esculenta]
MAGIAIVLDLLRKNPNFYSSQFSASAAVTAAAASVAAAGTPFASRFLFGYSGTRVAHCDAGAVLSDDYISNIRKASGDTFQHDSLKYTTKEYHVELKPLLSAFEWKQLAMTSLRSFLLFYLPLLEPASNTEEDDDDFLQDAPEERHVDFVVPFQKSVKQIVRETTVVTTRRILERLAVHYVSQRLAWKLLKDVPKSAVRKAERGMPTILYIFRVSRTTFRGHFLGVAASWIVQVGIEVYRFINRLAKSEEENNKVEKSEQVIVLGKKVTGVTLRCSASLVFASIGAGIGATLIRPSTGQWIGCAIGDLAGPIVVSLCLEKVLHTEL